MQIRRKEEAADRASADLARKVAALDQKDRSAAEKEQSLSSLTAELWAKASVAVCKCLSLQMHVFATANLYSCTPLQVFCSVGGSSRSCFSLNVVDASLCMNTHHVQGSLSLLVLASLSKGATLQVLPVWLPSEQRPTSLTCST